MYTTENNNKNNGINESFTTIELPSDATIPQVKPKTPREIDEETNRIMLEDLKKDGITVVDVPPGSQPANVVPFTIDKHKEQRLKRVKQLDSIEKKLKENEIDLMPRDRFRRVPSADGKAMVVANDPDNLLLVITYYDISIRYNQVSKHHEITLPSELGITEYDQDDENECKYGLIKRLCYLNGVPVNDLQLWITTIGAQNAYNPAADFILSKPWDGKSRLDDMMATVKSTNPVLTRKLMYRWFISCVAAAFTKKGISLHGVLVFQGSQGKGKTRWFNKLIPESHEDLRIDGQTLDPRNKDSVIECSTRWLVELGELDGTFNRTDLAILKAFLTRSRDNYRKAYAILSKTARRNTAYFASVNNTKYLSDETGNRRWWTVEVTEVNHHHDIDMQQFWAEVYEIYKTGEQHYLSDEEYELLCEENESHMAVSPMKDLILDAYEWGDEPKDLYYNRPTTAGEVLEFIDYDIRKGDAKKLTMECAKILEELTGNKSYRYNNRRVYKIPRAKGTPKDPVNESVAESVKS